MAKFEFKLESLLQIKQQMEDSLKNDMGKAIQRLELEKERFCQLEDERELCIRRFNTCSTEGIPVGTLKEYSIYIAHMKEKMENQKEIINKAQEIVDNYREQLVKVMGERKMLEKLKERKYEEFLKESMKAEQKTLDEIVSYNYNNRITGDENG